MSSSDRRTWRRVVALTSVTLLATGIGQVSLAGTASAESAGLVRLAGNVLHFDASQGHANDLIVDVGGLRGVIWFHFNDVHPIASALKQCRPASVPAGRFTLDCGFPVKSVNELVVRLFDRDDRAEFEEDRSSTPPGLVRVEGGSGDDRLQLDNISSPAGWPDIVLGGSGDDLIIADEADDIIYGGTGNDTVSYKQRDSAIIASLVVGEGGQIVLDERDVYRDVENLISGGIVNLGYGQDMLAGDAADNQIEAYGKAVIFGLGGDDTLLGGREDDYLFGGSGTDNLFGRAGWDYLQGGYGTDVCFPGMDGGTADCELVFGP